MSLTSSPWGEHCKNPISSEQLLIAPVQILDADGSYTAQAGLLIENGRIADRGGATEMTARHKTSKATDASDYLICPGLVNAHTHAAMGFFRDLGHEVSATEAGKSMIETFLFPAEKSLSEEMLEPLSYSYLLSGLRSGVTTFVDHYYMINGVGKALERMGLRGFIGETVADLGGAFPSARAWPAARDHIARWPFSARVRPVIAPHAADTVSAKLLTEMASFAKQHALPLHMHLSQTSGERERLAQREKISPVAFAARSGALSERTLAVHLISADQNDIQILSDHGVTVGFCPTSQILYEQLAPIEDFLRADLAIALGTDCAASNDSADLLTEMKFAALCAQLRGHKVSAKTVLSWATQQPMRALAGKNTMTPLHKGSSADFVMLRQDITTLPLQDAATNLIFSCGSQHVRHVMIDGKWVLWNQQPTLISEADMRATYMTAVASIKNRIGRN